MNQSYSKKTVRAWTFYDWANSVYSLVISTAIFPIYYESVAQVNGSDIVPFLGFEVTNTVIYSFTLSLSFFIVAVLSPLLSGIADYSGRKKSFLRRFCYMGAAACCALFFFDDVSKLPFALTGVLIASVGFWGSQVFYNAYLPEIAPKHLQDKISAKGYALGYIGSAGLLIACLILIEGHSWFGIESKGFATRLSFLITGIWWAGFAQITFKGLPDPKKRKSIKWKTAIQGYRELGVSKNVIFNIPVLKRYLLSFFMFSTGVQTVILLAGVFGSKTLGLSSDKLIITILLIQFLGIAGAYLFSKLSSLFGNFNALFIAIMVWMLICGAAYLLKKDDPWVTYKFFVLGSVVGLVMGGIQSLARSTYSKMLPPRDENTTFFSFYDVTEKIAIVLGTFSFGFIEQITGDMHYSALSLSLFFLISAILLYSAKRIEPLPVKSKPD